MVRFKSLDLPDDWKFSPTENLWKFPLILASVRKLEQLTEFNAIPLSGVKTLTEYEFQLQFNYNFLPRGGKYLGEMNNRSRRALLFSGRTDLSFPDKEAASPMVTFSRAFFILRLIIGADRISICGRNTDTQLSPSGNFKFVHEFISISLTFLPSHSQITRGGILSPCRVNLFPPRNKCHLWEVLKPSSRFAPVKIAYGI